MHRLAKLQNRRAAIVKRLTEINDAAAAEERLTHNEAEAAEYAALEGELGQVAAAVAREEKLQEAEKHLARVPDPCAETASEAAARRGEQPQFESFGQMLQAVARAAGPRHAVDERLRFEAAATGLNEGVPSEGGFLVGVETSNELMRNTYETGQIASRCSRTPIGAAFNGLKINGVDETSRADGSQWGGVVAYWKAEAAAKTASKPKFRQVELNLKKLIGLCYATDELLQDAVALEAVMMEAFPNVFAFKLDDAIIRGTGAGQPLGILTGAVNLPRVRVAKETGQAADTIVAENVEKMYARMWARGLSNAAWFINQDCWPQIFQLHHVVGTGGVPMFIPAGGINAAPFGTLLGRPIVPVEQCATVGDEGDIIFADFSQYKLIDKGGIQTASSIHVQFLYDESVFRWVLRVDGQPLWSSCLTPAQGSNTVSPFITLAARA